MQLPWQAGAAPPPIGELRHPALIEEKVSPGRRGENDGQRARPAIERITPAVFAIAPPDLRFIDAGGICIDGLEIVIDRNSPSRAAVRIGACDGDRSGLRSARCLPERPPSATAAIAAASGRRIKMFLASASFEFAKSAPRLQSAEQSKNLARRNFKEQSSAEAQFLS